jgi:hypothetical protein
VVAQQAIVVLAAGSATDWIQAILAVLASGAAAFGWWVRRKNKGLEEDKARLEREKLELETMKVALEARAAEAAEIERASTQAKKIEIGPGEHGLPLVANRSDGPIFEIVVTMFGLDNGEPGGRYSHGYPSLRAREEYQVSLPESFGFPNGVDLRFQDAAGVRWRRDEFGALQPADTLPRVFTVRRPPRD